MQTLLKPIENDLCFKHSENPEALRKILSLTVVKVENTGCRKHFPDDTDKRIVLAVEITREGKTAAFDFGMSIRDSCILSPESYEESAVCRTLFPFGKFKTLHDVTAAMRKIPPMRKEVNDGILYSILTCVRSEYSCPATFDDFCTEFGYDTDSRKAYRTFEACTEQSRKLSRVFTPEEIESFPS